jgi:hypothetical protein
MPDYPSKISVAAPMEYHIYTPVKNGTPIKSTVWIAYEELQDERPIVYHTFDPPFFGTFTQVSRLLTGIVGREVKVVSWGSESLSPIIRGRVIYKGEKY